MRSVKFRAWTGTEMEYRVVAGQLGAFYVEGLDPKDSASMSPFNTIYSPATPIMQFTGLLALNGKEIYEGDIVINPCHVSIKCPHCQEPLVPRDKPTVIEWDSIHAMWKKPHIDWGQYYEILGNIHENPELLK